jgi:hypothetical protein
MVQYLLLGVRSACLVLIFLTGCDTHHRDGIPVHSYAKRSVARSDLSCSDPIRKRFSFVSNANDYRRLKSLTASNGDSLRSISSFVALSSLGIRFDDDIDLVFEEILELSQWYHGERTNGLFCVITPQHETSLSHWRNRVEKIRAMNLFEYIAIDTKNLIPAEAKVLLEGTRDIMPVALVVRLGLLSKYQNFLAEGTRVTYPATAFWVPNVETYIDRHRNPFERFSLDGVKLASFLLNEMEILGSPIPRQDLEIVKTYSEQITVVFSLNNNAEKRDCLLPNPVTGCSDTTRSTELGALSSWETVCDFLGALSINTNFGFDSIEKFPQSWL